MKKLFLFSLVVLLIAGGSWAASIPTSEDAENGPGIWYLPVYNNSGSSIAKGSTVVWDIASSTGDDDNYITTTTTADTFVVAGIVWPNAIGAISRGTIAIRGVVTVNLDAGPVPVEDASGGSLLCSAEVAGLAQVCSNGSSDADGFAFTVATPGTGDVKAFIYGR